MVDKKISFQDALAIVKKNFKKNLNSNSNKIALETEVDTVAFVYLQLAFNRQSTVILDELLAAIRKANVNIDYLSIISKYSNEYDIDIINTTLGIIEKILPNATDSVNLLIKGVLLFTCNMKKGKLFNNLIALQDILDDRTTDNIIIDVVNESIKDTDLNESINNALKNHLELLDNADLPELRLNKLEKKIIKKIRINENELNKCKRNLLSIKVIYEKFTFSSKPGKTIDETNLENIILLFLKYQLQVVNFRYQVQLRLFNGSLQYNNEGVEDGIIEYDPLDFSYLSSMIMSF